MNGMEAMKGFDEAAYHAAANAHGRQIILALVLVFLGIIALLGLAYLIKCVIKGHQAFRQEELASVRSRPNIRHNPPRPRDLR